MVFYQPEISHGVNHLEVDESRHAVKVLRLKEGSQITIVDGRGSTYLALITNSNHKKCEFNIIEQNKSENRDYSIHIAIAPTKNIERIEWFVEKAVEIGIDQISFIVCSNNERRVVKIERIVKKAISAMKQSLKSELPRVNIPRPFNEFVKEQSNLQANESFIAYVDLNNQETLIKQASKNKNYCVLIGPEGDFTEKELDYALKQGFRKTSLGNTRLRTETAGLVACHLLNLVNT